MSGGWLEALSSEPRRGPAAVAWELRERVRRNQIANGHRLRQVEVMAEWRLPPAEARAAMAILGRIGVVRQEPSGGAVVYRPTRAQIEESWRVVAALEALATEAAARDIDRPRLDRLEATLKEMRGVRPHELFRHLLFLDPAFHEDIGQATGLRRLQALIAEARTAASIGVMLVAREHIDDPRQLYHAHAAIFEALAAHDPAAAREAVRVHYTACREHWMRAWDEGTRDEVKASKATAS